MPGNAKRVPWEPLPVGLEVWVRGKVAESYPGDTCVRVETGDSRRLLSIWVRTDDVVEQLPFDPEFERRMW